MRLLLILLVQSACLSAAEPQYPLGDGHESVAAYAKKTNLPPTKTLDLGNGVNMELVLIPAGKFVMGTPEPTPVDEDGFQKQIFIGQAGLAASAAALLVMLTVIIVRAIRKRQRPKYSLLWLLAMTATAGVGVIGGLHWRQSTQELETARIEYPAAKEDFDLAYAWEKPAHAVMLTKPFFMGKFVVTQEQYFQIQGSNPSAFKGNKDNPVDSVSWNDAREFCKKLNGKAKETVRLPTEAEWECACPAGGDVEYYSGATNLNLDRVAWYSANSTDTTHPVGHKEQNTFGLFDMHGNVWQWCQDWYAQDYYAKSPAKDPEGPFQGTYRVLRGGSWELTPWFCRSAFRHCQAPENHDGRVGFRVVVEIASAK